MESGATRIVLPFDLCGALDALAPDVPEILAPPAELARARRFVDGIPPVLHWGVIETRLTSDAGRVDLLAAVMDGPGGREGLLAGLRERPDHRGWTGAASLLEAWAERRSSLLDDVHVVWLEWDAPFDRPDAAVPLSSIDPRFWGDRSRGADPDRQVAVAAEAYEATFGHPHDPDVLAALRHAIVALPASGQAIFTACMQGRGTRLDRLFVGLPRAEVIPWLDAIDWPGDRHQVARWLPRVVAAWEMAYLQVEVSPQTTPYLGIEPQQTQGTKSELRERRWFLERLAADGLTTTEKVEAVLGWADRRSVIALDGQPAQDVRSLHLKCVLHPGRPPEVKGYLGFHHER